MQSINPPAIVEQAPLPSRRLRVDYGRGPAEIAGLRPIESQDKTLQPAMRALGEMGEYPWNMGWSRETRLGLPTHLSGPEAEGSMGWRTVGSDIINVNRAHPFYQTAQTNKDVVPLLSSILYHENSHVDGADELEALRRQAGMLGRVKNNPMALKAAEIFSRLGAKDVVGTR